MRTGPRLNEGVVVVVRRGERLLVIRRAPGLLAEGAWCFVGGGIEPGESQEQAVVREFREEVGAAVRPVEKIWEYWRPDRRLRLHWWMGEVDADAELSPNPLEVAELRWCTTAEIQALDYVLESNRYFLQTIGRRLFGPHTAAG